MLTSLYRTKSRDRVAVQNTVAPSTNGSRERTLKAKWFGTSYSQLNPRVPGSAPSQRKPP